MAVVATTHTPTAWVTLKHATCSLSAAATVQRMFLGTNLEWFGQS